MSISDQLEALANPANSNLIYMQITQQLKDELEESDQQDFEPNWEE